jgi:hypothetical protein
MLQIFGGKSKEQKFHELDHEFCIFIVDKKSESYLEFFEKHLRECKFNAARILKGNNEKYILVYKHSYHHFNDLRKGLSNMVLEEIMDDKRKRLVFEAIRWS